jgi:hypothetical protein
MANTTMAELAFVKTFLSVVDSKAIKIPADHVFDPERVGLRVPVVLPMARTPILHAHCHRG